MILFCNQVLNSLLKDASTVTIYKDVEHTNVNICNNPRSLEGGRGQIDPPPSIFFCFKFLLLDRLSKVVAQLFLVCEHIF